MDSLVSDADPSLFASQMLWWTSLIFWRPIPVPRFDIRRLSCWHGSWDATPAPVKPLPALLSRIPTLQFATWRDASWNMVSRYLSVEKARCVQFGEAATAFGCAGA
jgi:hypothetical protein